MSRGTLAPHMMRLVDVGLVLAALHGAAATVSAPTAGASALELVNAGLALAQASGDISVAKGHFVAATALRAAEDGPIRAKAFELLSHCHLVEGHHRSASRALTSALECCADPEQRNDLNLLLARAFESMGDGAGAIGAVLETSPLEREAKLLLANVLSDCYGDTRTALELYRECTDEDESDEVALWLHGVAASSQGAHDEAATCFERAAQLPAGEDDVDIAVFDGSTELVFGEDELIRDEVRLGSQWAVGCGEREKLEGWGLVQNN